MKMDLDSCPSVGGTDGTLGPIGPWDRWDLGLKDPRYFLLEANGRSGWPGSRRPDRVKFYVTNTKTKDPGRAGYR